MSTPASTTEPVRAYPLFMLALSVLALLLLGASAVLPLTLDQAEILDLADTAVCVFFLLDFLVQLVRAEDRWRYFRTWGWLDLLSSIPLIDIFRLGRVVRIVRLVRLLRAVRAARALSSVFIEQRAQSGVLGAGLIAIVITFVASLGILQVERDAGGNIHTAGDALWWAVTTITTVGYGDHFPVTPEGRMIAVFLMFAGIGLFGTLSGFLAAWFTPQPTADNELADVKRELAEIKRLLEERER